MTAGASCSRRVGSLQAVTEVSLAVRRGETFGLVGESGCGKTTLGRMGVALESPDRRPDPVRRDRLGDAQGRRPSPPAPRPAAHVPGSLLLAGSPHAGQGDHVRAARHRQAGDPAGARGRGHELLDEVGLARDAEDRYPHEFSGGQRQRLGFARALALNPKVIVADEPVSALDVSIRSQILNLMKPPAGGPRAHLHRHLPRPVGRALSGRPHRRDVPRAAGRDR